MSFNYSIITLIYGDKYLFLSEKMNYYDSHLTHDVWGPRQHQQFQQTKKYVLLECSQEREM